MPLLCLLLALCAVLAMGLGHYPVPFSTVLGILASAVLPDGVGQSGADYPAAVTSVILAVRLPRVLAAMMVGAALAAAGAAYQAMFRNPLASPALLGVSAGAGFGASLAMLLDAGAIFVQGSAFAGGLLAVGAAVLLAARLGRSSMLVLVLGGLVVSALFAALTSALKYLADPLDTLPGIVFWLLGSLAKASMDQLWPALIPVSLGLAILLLLRWQTQVLEVGDDEARTLGIRVHTIRLLLIVSATLMTAAAVSVAGIVGWVGLLIPHLARLLVGATYPLLLPVATLMGAGYLLLVDTLCRTAFALELPLGVATAVIGAPLFVAVLSRARRQWT